MYHMYNTEAFVLGGMPAGESSRFMYLFTKDLGLVGVRAQNVRSITSKLRYALDDFSHSKVSLVRGKQMWRLTNAAPHKNFFLTFRDRPEARDVSTRILSVVRMLVAGEEANPALFAILTDAFSFLETHAHDSEHTKNLEAILMLRILDNLGYFGSHETLGEFVQGTEWTPELLTAMQSKRRDAIVVINAALRATNL